MHSCAAVELLLERISDLTRARQGSFPIVGASFFLKGEVLNHLQTT